MYYDYTTLITDVHENNGPCYFSIWYVIEYIENDTFGTQPSVSLWMEGSYIYRCRKSKQFVGEFQF